jgi:hypothetical protein
MTSTGAGFVDCHNHLTSVAAREELPTPGDRALKIMTSPACGTVTLSQGPSEARPDQLHSLTVVATEPEPISAPV